ncbi:perlucin-like [Argopecten irradians]|uniref:perlucin-like n=1 Tax=Argopecten irradians TaxID=31199 RepID=UPI003717CCBC
MNAHLAEVGDENEDNFLKTLISSYQSHKNYWLGGSDANAEGVWQWMQNNHPINYTNWGHGQPNNLHGKNCLVLHYNPPDFNWKAFDCMKYHNYICETENSSWIILG